MGHEKKRLSIDLSDLRLIIEDSDPEHEFYLDLDTGEILYYTDDDISDELEEVKALLEEYPDRYVFIEPLQPRELPRLHTMGNRRAGR